MNEWKECPKCKCMNKGRDRCQDCGRDLKDVAGDSPLPPITAEAKPDCAPRTGSVAHPGVWCCERRGQCRWKCYALEAAGLQWGTPDQVTPEWLKWHKRECGGRLVQLVPPNADSSRREL